RAPCPARCPYTTLFRSPHDPGVADVLPRAVDDGADEDRGADGLRGPADLVVGVVVEVGVDVGAVLRPDDEVGRGLLATLHGGGQDRKSTRLNSSHDQSS